MSKKGKKKKQVNENGGKGRRNITKASTAGERKRASTKSPRGEFHIVESGKMLVVEGPSGCSAVFLDTRRQHQLHTKFLFYFSSVLCLCVCVCFHTSREEEFFFIL